MDKNATFGNAAKILITEDEAVVAMSLESSLTARGYQVCGIASSGKRTLRLVEQTAPDLVIMDIKIKGDMNGVETARALKKRFSIPVIFLTAFSNTPIVQSAQDVEPLGFVGKPFCFDELDHILQDAFKKN